MKRPNRSNLILLLTAAALLLGLAFAQTSEEQVPAEPPADIEDLEELGEFEELEALMESESEDDADATAEGADAPEPLAAEPDLEEETLSAEGLAAPGDEDPLAGLDAEEAAAAQATGDNMERFRPSERISEDRSVAFPNDI